MSPRAATTDPLPPAGGRLSTSDLGFFFDERHHALAADLAGVAARLAHSGDHTLTRDGVIDLARALGERDGLYSWLLPRGDDERVNVRALCLVREMLAYVWPLADSLFAVQGLCAFPIAVAGSPAQRARHLPGLETGAAIGAFALTEPEAGSDVASLRTTARADGVGYVLSGDKTLISNADVATVHVVFANVDPAGRRDGITAFVVDAETPGLTATPIALSVEHPIGALRLEGVRVGRDAVLGEIGGGFSLAMRTLDTFRVSVGAAAVGMARRALDETLAHVRARSQFGKPLAEQPVVQSYLAEMATELDAARLLVLRAAHGRDAGRERAGGEAAMAKLYATEAAQRIVDLAVQLHGGRGVTAGETVEHLYRAVRPLRIYEGTSEIQRIVIARSLLRGR